MYVITIVWSVALMGEALIRVALVFQLTTAQFLLVSPFVQYDIPGAMIAWTMWYSRRMRKQGEAQAVHASITEIANKERPEEDTPPSSLSLSPKPGYVTPLSL